MKKLFKMLENGGKIISSNDLTALEINEAKIDHRMYVREDGF